MQKYTNYQTDKQDGTPTTPTTMGGDYYTDKRDKTEYRRRRRKTQKRTHKKRYGGRKTDKRTEKRYRKKNRRRG